MLINPPNTHILPFKGQEFITVSFIRLSQLHNNNNNNHQGGLKNE